MISLLLQPVMFVGGAIINPWRARCARTDVEMRLSPVHSVSALDLVEQVTLFLIRFDAEIEIS